VNPPVAEEMPTTRSEPGRNVPVLASYDVVVCGGGPAGCAAAVAAARNGARTLVLEKEGYLGGAPCTQLVCVILSTNGVDFQGIWHEYIARLQARKAVRPFSRPSPGGHIRSVTDPEQVKFVWDELLTEAGVEMLHHTYGAVCAVEDGAAKGVFVETRAGRQAILAKCVVDATGDGIVAAQTGITFEQGDGEHLWAMALTKMFRMGNVRKPANWPDEEALARIERELTEAIERGEYTAPVIVEKKRFMGYVRNWSWAMPENRTEFLSLISRVLKVNPLDPFDLTRAEREGREQARQAADAFCRFVPGFEEAYLLDTSNQIGVRSSRRLRGIATVSDEDVWNFNKYPDSIARASWDVDVWPADSYSKAAVPLGTDGYKWRQDRMARGDYFDIPYGAIVADGVDNLFMAGRCISASHLAQASLRIQQTCMSTGQAAGTAAALCVRTGASPRTLDPQRVIRQLEQDRAAVKPALDVSRL